VPPLRELPRPAQTLHSLQVSCPYSLDCVIFRFVKLLEWENVNSKEFEREVIKMLEFVIIKIFLGEDAQRADEINK
jgi:hypothetical protein